MENQILDQLQKSQTPGAFVLVVQNGKEIYKKGLGFADAQGNVPMNDNLNLIFNVGSLTKTFTAYALLELERRGDISIDDPVGKYLSYIAPGLKSITLRQLLMHTGGLVSDLPYTHDSSLKAFAASLNEDIAFLPKKLRGQIHSYSNIGPTLLGCVIEEATGLKYSMAIQAILLDPLGMQRTTTCPNPKEIAKGHLPIHEGGRTRLELASGSLPTPCGRLPSGGIWSCLEDVSHLIRAWINDGKLDDRRVLDPEILEAMQSARSLSPSFPFIDYGLGLELHESGGRRFFGHAGTDPDWGFRCVLIMSGNKGVFVWGNSLDCQPREMANIIWRQMGFEIEPPPSALPPISISEAELDECVGTYRQGPYRTNVITREGEQLFMENAFIGKQPLIPIGPDRFCYRMDGFLKEVFQVFLRDARPAIPRGPVYGLSTYFYVLMKD